MLSRMPAWPDNALPLSIILSSAGSALPWGGAAQGAGGGCASGAHPTARAAVAGGAQCRVPAWGNRGVACCCGHSQHCAAPSPVVLAAGEAGVEGAPQRGPLQQGPARRGGICGKQTGAATAEAVHGGAGRDDRTGREPTPLRPWGPWASTTRSRLTFCISPPCCTQSTG